MAALSPIYVILFFLCQFLIHLHQCCYAVSLGHVLDIETVCTHNGFIILLVCLAKFRWHRQLIIEICKAAVRIQCSGV